MVITMGNTINIAKKEFAGLIGDPCIIFILITYLVMILSAIGYIDLFLYRGMAATNSEFASLMLDQNVSFLTGYGSVVALMIGFSSMSSEQFGHAFNTLVSKPLYRDTILNGKLLGCLSFIVCIFLFMTSLFISILILLYSGKTISALPLYLERLPLILLLSLIYVTIFMSFSMLISTVVKSQGVALILAILSFVFINMISMNISFAGNLSILFGANQGYIANIISSISPFGIMNSILSNDVFSHSLDLAVILQSIGFDILKLLFLIIVIILLNYSLLLRRDIQ